MHFFYESREIFISSISSNLYPAQHSLCDNIMTHLSSDYVRRYVFTHQGCAYLNVSKDFWQPGDVGWTNRTGHKWSGTHQTNKTLKQKSQHKNYYLDKRCNNFSNLMNNFSVGMYVEVHKSN